MIVHLGGSQYIMMKEVENVRRRTTIIDLPQHFLEGQNIYVIIEILGVCHTQLFRHVCFRMFKLTCLHCRDDIS